MNRRKYIPLDVLIAKYLKNAEAVNACNIKLLNCKKGFFSKKLKSTLVESKIEHAKYLSILEELEINFIGDLETTCHGNLAHISSTSLNQEVISRARHVLVSSLQRLESTLTTVEDSFKFNQTVGLAKLSIFISISTIVAQIIFKL
ncbi:hypothetical protein [Aliivibrio fischeri]|uniref:hypothetical protein n=1 Tax=Aliivibrio fischeri TaxID=668 RepID=UPI0007C4FDAE|nr:hypothetical protein [Aliivibrio fischeri]